MKLDGLTKYASAVFLIGSSAALTACGEALPSAVPLSAPTSHPLARVRPSSARAIEPGTEERSSVESDAAAPGDDDDDDSNKTTTGIPHGTRLIPE
jgi:hypothetical protein